MARKPNFDFERLERQKAKDAKRAEKTQKKSEKKPAGSGDPDRGIPASIADGAVST